MNKEVRSEDIDIAIGAQGVAVIPDQRQQRVPLSRVFLRGKRAFDVLVALIAMPFVGITAVVLVMINPIWNRGPVFFAQKRMGRRCQPFMAYKFRTMRDIQQIQRGPYDPVETDRITRLGRLLRATRIDEFPQFFNVLRGEMSVIGPRPDFWDHAQHYTQTVPGYRRRHSIRPGITGLAQVDAGYAEDQEALAKKVRLDLRYISAANPAMDWYIIRRTCYVMTSGFGAR